MVKHIRCDTCGSNYTNQMNMISHVFCSQLHSPKCIGHFSGKSISVYLGRVDRDRKHLLMIFLSGFLNDIFMAELVQ